ncbi:MaoC family dehydratase [Chloroflexota bacterium]
MNFITKYIQDGHEFRGSPKIPTQERVNNFSGGYPKGPGWPKKTIHTNLEFAKSCGLTACAASGAMPEGYLTQLMIELFGIDWLRHGKMTLKFIATVKPDDTVLPKAIVRDRQIEDRNIRFIMEVWCENQDGKKVVVGTASGLLQQ